MADFIEKVAYDYLLADSAFMANFANVYWIEADKKTYPYIVFWKIDDIGTETLLNTETQGEARIQFDLWDDSKVRGARLAGTLRDKVRALNEVRGGLHVDTNGITENTLQRASTTEPFHFVVDGIIKWEEE